MSSATILLEIYRDREEGAVQVLRKPYGGGRTRMSTLTLSLLENETHFREISSDLFENCM